MLIKGMYVITSQEVLCFLDAPEPYSRHDDINSLTKTIFYRNHVTATHIVSLLSSSFILEVHKSSCESKFCFQHFSMNHNFIEILVQMLVVINAYCKLKNSSQNKFKKQTNKQTKETTALNKTSLHKNGTFTVRNILPWNYFIISILSQFAACFSVLVHLLLFSIWLWYFSLTWVILFHMSSASEKVMSHLLWIVTKSWEFVLHVWQLIIEAGFNPIWYTTRRERKLLLFFFFFFG